MEGESELRERVGEWWIGELLLVDGLRKTTSVVPRGLSFATLLERLINLPERLAELSQPRYPRP